MKTIIEKVRKHIKNIDKKLDVISYIELNDSYIFAYMLEIDNPQEFINAEKYNNKYFVPLIDNSYVEYEKETGEIKEFNYFDPSNLEKVKDLEFKRIDANK